MGNRVIGCYQQQGFSLVIVMMIMVVIALLVIAGAQVSNTEMRISTNNADQKYAKGLAERALLIGEKQVAEVAITASTSSSGGGTGNQMSAQDDDAIAQQFPAEGANGLYGYDNANPNPRTGPSVWEQDDVWDNANKSIEATGVRCNSGCKNPRYIIEYLGKKDVDGQKDLRVFRVTARAWGENPNTVSTVQSVIVAPSPSS
ncbi:MAG: hypothetical protein IKI11_08780 [Neisseriaceae bacterium]|nr:hypothetical protein [Neisseriaceae bacterium]